MKPARICQPIAEPVDRTTIDLTPLLDVVFIMLIFFVVTASFVRETGIDLLAPDDGPPAPIPTTNIHVVIDDQDVVLVDGRVVDPRRVGIALAALAAQRPEAMVVVDPKAGSSVQMFVTVVDASRQAGIDSYRIAQMR